MKSIFILFLLALLYEFSFAQKNFEGEIIFKNISKFDTAKNGFIKVFLRGKKMLLSNETKINEIPTYTLYDFEKGKSFVSIPSDSIVITTDLMESPFKEIINSLKSNEVILGYNCLSTPYKVYAPMSNYISSIDAFFSEKLLFRVPLNMRFVTPPLIFFNDSCISIGIKIRANQILGSDLKNNDLEYKAIRIQEKILDETLFEIPKYLKEKSAIEYSIGLMEKFKKVEKDLNATNKEIETSVKKMVEAAKQKPNIVPKRMSKKNLKKRLYK